MVNYLDGTWEIVSITDAAGQVEKFGTASESDSTNYSLNHFFSLEFESCGGDACNGFARGSWIDTVFKLVAGRTDEFVYDRNQLKSDRLEIYFGSEKPEGGNPNMVLVIKKRDKGLMEAEYVFDESQAPKQVVLRKTSSED